MQVRKLLSSAEPTTVNIANAPEVGDPEMQALQQARLLALGMRTMTLPLGRGALTLGNPPTLDSFLWGASHPAVCAVARQHHVYALPISVSRRGTHTYIHVAMQAFARHHSSSFRLRNWAPWGGGGGACPAGVFRLHT